MKQLISIVFALCLCAAAWAQEKPDSPMWFDSGMLYFGNKTAHVTSDTFASTVGAWKVGRVHIAISAETTPEMIIQLLMAVPFKDVSYSLTLDKDRIAASSATERYYRNLPETEGIPFTSADVKPLFVDGSMEEWIRKKADELYPRECWENGIQGRVLVQFTIDENGRVGNVKVLRGAAPQLDKIAQRIVLSMPDWRPACDAAGKPIKVSYNIPIIFKH